MNWGLFAALAGIAVLVVLILVVAVVAWNSLPKGNLVGADPTSSRDKQSASPPVTNVPLKLPEGPQIQVGPIGAASEPQPRALPASEPPNLPAGQTITLGEGRFTVWVPTQEPLAEKVDGSGADLFRYHDLTAANGAAIRVMAAYGSEGQHIGNLIQTSRKLSGKPRSILEEPWVVIEHQGVTGTVTERRQQRYTKASRRRDFYYQGVGLVISAVGTDEQVNSPEIDWFFASLKFGQPEH